MLSQITNKQKVTVMIGVMLTLFLASLDQTIVATAAPKIVEDLKGLELLSWVFNAYMLSSTVIIPIYGKLSDLYGRKFFFLASIVVFLIGSILSGIAQNMNQLIIFRVIQGLGGGAMMVNSFAIIGDLFAPLERGKWQGALAGVFGLSSVVGPTLGGWLTDAVSWRWNFFINLPIGIIALAVIGFLMPHIVPDIKKKSVDYLGSVFLAGTLTTLLLALLWGGNQYAWNSWPIISLFISSIILLGAFIFVENKVEEPVIPLSLFKNSIFTITIFITFLIGMGLFSSIIYIPFFAQSVIGISATHSGIILTPLMLGMVFSSILSGQIVSRWGKYKILINTGLTIATLALFFLSSMSPSTNQVELAWRMVATGIGIGLTMPILVMVVQNAFGHSQLGVVTASTQVARSIGGTVGVAIMGSILNNTLTGKLTDIAKDKSLQTVGTFIPQLNPESFNINKLQGFLYPEGQRQIQMMLTKLPDYIKPQAMQTFQEFMGKIKNALTASISDIFTLATFFMAAAVFISFLLKEIPLRKSFDEEPEPSSSEPPPTETPETPVTIFENR